MAGHVAPEAARGGPIAALRDGDIVVFDVPGRELRVELTDDEIRETAGGVDAAAASIRPRRHGEVRARGRVGSVGRRHRRGPPDMAMTGARILWECLVREGSRSSSAIRAASVLPLYDALHDYPIRHVLARHEQGAAHMADGYARASGRVGVVLATSGPGATNLVTGIATAMLDSTPDGLPDRAGGRDCRSARTPSRRSTSPA